MKITDIQTQSKKENRVSVFIDNKFAFGLEKADCSFMGLKIGMKISKEKYDYILNNTLYTKAYQKADRFLGFKMRTEKEVYIKLKDLEYPEEIITKVIKTLKKYNYINDTQYAILYAKDCQKLKKWGEARIKLELIKKGVSSQDISVALNELEDVNIDMITSLLEKRIKSTPIDFKEKQKHFNFLLRRGFKSEDIKRALEKYC